MLWLKQYVVPMLPHEVIIAKVVYLAVLRSYGKSIALFPTMAARIQSGLCALAKSFCHVEAIVNAEGHLITDSNGRPWSRLPVPGSSSHICT